MKSNLEKVTLYNLVKKRIKKNNKRYFLLGIISFVVSFLLTAVFLFVGNAVFSLNNIGGEEIKQIIISLLTFALIISMTSFAAINGVMLSIEIQQIDELKQIKLIGATAEQLLKCVRHEKNWIFLRFSSFGIVCGIILIIFFPIKKDIFISCVCVIVSALMAYLCITLGMKKTIKFVSNVQIFDESIELVKPRKRIKVKYKIPSIKTVTYKYLMENKNRAIGIIFSFALCEILMVVTLSVMNSINPQIIAKEPYLYNSSIYLELLPDDVGDYYYSQANTPFTEKLKNNILQIEGISNIYFCKAIDFAKSINGEYDFVLQSFGKKSEVIDNLKEGQWQNTEEHNMIPIIINKGAYWYENDASNYHVGDCIKIYINNGTQKENIMLEVQGFINNPSDLTVFYTDQKYIDDFSDVKRDIKWFIEIAENVDLKYIKKEIKDKVFDENLLAIHFLDDDIEMYKTGFSIFTKSIFILSVLFSVFSVINLIDVCFSNIIVRKKEIGILRALGIKKKELLFLANFENMMFVFTSLMISIFLGIPTGYLCCMLIENILGLTYVIYQVPKMHILLFIIYIVIVSGCIAVCQGSYVLKDSSIENIRRWE